MQKFLFIFVLISYTLQECGKGCLRCSPNNECLICDYHKFIILDPETKSCTQAQIENCEQIDIQGLCITCQSGYYIDQGQCVQVETLIPNCERYFSQKTCILCQTNYALIQSECVPAIQIPGCAHHLDDITKCYECQEGRILNIEQKLCLSIEDFGNENCLSYNFVDCQLCKPGYILNRNNYLVESNFEFTSEQSSFLLSLLYAFKVHKSHGQSNFSTCSKVQIENCLKLISFNQCEICENGFFLDSSKNCQKNPIDNIQHCEIYSSKNQCQQCRNEYYMQTENVCVDTTTIENCVDYDRTIDGVCLICDDDYFSEGTSCTLREQSNNIENCIQKNNQRDICAECDEGYITNLDGLICLEQIPFCLEYEKQNSSVACTKCEQNYFLKESLCYQGQIENCLEYESETECKVCENQYHLNIEKTCTQNSFFDNLNCLQSDSSSKNLCTRCPSNRAKIHLNGVCQPVQTVIQNCYKYADAFNCLQCKSEYSYLSDNICKLGTIKNCNKYHPTKNMCLSCQIDYSNDKQYVTYPKQQENNQCVEVSPNITYQCQQLMSKDDKIICDQCVKNYYPFTFSTQRDFFCVPKDFYMIDQEVNLDYCIIYDSQKNTCLKCEKGTFLSKEGLCEEKCSQGYIVSPFKLNNNFETDVYSEIFFKCMPSTDYSMTTFNKDPLDCQIIDTIITTNSSESYCGYCDENSVGELLTRTATITLDYLPVLNNINRNQNNIILPVQKCLNKRITVGSDTNFQQTKVSLFSENGNQVPANLQNCRYIKQIESGKYGCVACKHGYSGKVVYDINKAGFFIGKCELIQNCISQTYYQGAGSGLLQFSLTERIYPTSFYLTCHFCKNNQIPTFGILMNSQTATDTLPLGDQFFIYPFYIPTNENETPLQTSITNKDSTPLTTCQENGLGKFRTLNCAAQEIAIDRQLLISQNDYNLMNPRCIACLPGYIPTWAVTTTAMDKSNYVKECNTIKNCDLKNTISFNRCDQCRGFNSLVYDKDKPNLTEGLECKSVSIANCLIFDFDQDVCKLCQKGFILNLDNICDQVESKSCVSQGFYDAMNQELANNYGWEGLGCLECDENSIGIAFFQKQTSCILNFQLFSGRSFTSSEILIHFCQIYGPLEGEENKVICKQCIQEYVLSSSGKKCFLRNDKLTNCKKYTEDGESCAICDSLYYVDVEGLCRKGKIFNCLVYQDESTCAQCAPDYLLIKKKTKQICLEVPLLNCELFSQQQLNLSKLQCEICSKDHYNEFNADVFGTFPLNFCGLIPDIERCIIYETEPNIQQADLMCQQCEDEYFSEEGFCVVRQNYPIPNCQIYNPKADNCSQCNNKYFLNEEYFCEVFPSGIVSCQDYFNEITCIRCLPNKYQKGDVCVNIPEPSIIENCEYYESDFSCSQCVVGYYLKSGSECVQASAKDCLEYENENICKSCQDNYGLVPSGNVISCVEIILSNCEIPNTELENGNFTCQKCKISFYKNEVGECIAVPQLIKYCMYYDSQNTCQVCLDGYVIAKDKKSCEIDQSLIQYADPNCQISFETKEPICNICKPGYVFEDALSQNCIKCDDLIDRGCLICDINSKAQCLICQSGFYMDAEGKCNAEISNEVEQTIKNIQIVKVCIYLLFIILF